jgi:hypothetical protein
MSESKAPLVPSAGSSSTVGGVKPALALIGDTAQNHVFGQMTFIVNRTDHLVSQQTMASTGVTKAFDVRALVGKANAENEAWRKEAKAELKKRDPFGGGERMGYLGALYLALSKPPKTGCCGEMALLAYRKCISEAILAHRSVGVAMVTIADTATATGNHSFVLLGSEPSFIRVLAVDPATLTVPLTAVPSTWGREVYVCDPWLDAGHCATFCATDRETRIPETRWEAFLRRVGRQAGDEVIAAAFAAGAAATIVLDVNACTTIKAL